MFDSAASVWILAHPRIVVAVAAILHLGLGIIGVLRNYNYSPLLKLVSSIVFILADMVSFAQFVFPFIVSSKIDHWLIGVWTAFFIRYLGGFDTFTALSLEDNELWLRRAFRISIFCLAYGFVIFQCFLEGMLPMISIAVILLVFIGICCCAERILAHKLGSKSELRSSSQDKSHKRPRPDLLNVLDRVVASERSGEPSTVIGIDHICQGPSMWSPPSSFSRSDKSRIQTIKTSFEAHTKFRGLFMGKRYSSEDRIHNQNLFGSVPSNQAFQIVHNQIQFVSEELHSKALLLHTKWGLISRLFDIAVLFYCLISCIISVRHHGFPLPDVIMTYMVIVLEILKAGFALYWLVFSPQIIVQVINSKWSIKESVVKVMLKLLRKNPKLSIGQIDFFQLHLYSSQPSRFQRFVCFFFPKEESENYLLGKRVNITDNVVGTTCRVLEEKSKMAIEAEEYESFMNGTGEWTLKQARYQHCTIEFGWSVKKRFTCCALMWTIATTLLYHGCGDLMPSNELETAKCFSDYFLYLLRVRPGVLSSAEDAVNTLEDAFLDLKSFLKGSPTQFVNIGQEACQQILQQNTDHLSNDLMGGSYESVFWDGVKLAKELLDLDPKDRDQIMCEVWVELLSYAAIHCSGEYHLELLPQGIELLSIIWMIAFKLGLGQQYKVECATYIHGNPFSS